MYVSLKKKIGFQNFLFLFSKEKKNLIENFSKIVVCNPKISFLRMISNTKNGNYTKVWQSWCHPGWRSKQSKLLWAVFIHPLTPPPIMFRFQYFTLVNIMEENPFLHICILLFETPSTKYCQLSLMRNVTKDIFFSLSFLMNSRTMSKNPGIVDKFTAVELFYTSCFFLEISIAG